MLDAALSHGKPMWWNASDIETVEEMIHKGVRMFLYDSDIVMLDNALRMGCPCHTGTAVQDINHCMVGKATYGHGAAGIRALTLLSI